MKTRAPRIAATNILLAISVILVSSCTQYYFQYPQPIDRKNIYHFPKTFRGSWEEKEDTTTHSFSAETTLDSTAVIPPAPDTMVAINSDTIEHKASIEWPSRENLNVDSSFTNANDSTIFAEQTRMGCIPDLDLDSISIKIKGKAIQIINIQDERVDRPCVLIAGSKEDQDLKAYDEEYHRSKDSVAEPMGKRAKYYLKANLIYEIDKGKLKPGYEYDTSGNEFIIHRVDTLAIELGHYAFLRKLNKKFWVLNVSSQEREDEGWWSIYILEKSGRRAMRLWICDDKLETLSMFFSTDIHNDDYYYFDHRWSAAELLKLIQDGHFATNDSWYERL